MGHLIEKKYQVTGHYLCTKHILVYPELHFWRMRNGEISYDRLEKDTSTQLQQCVF